MFNEEMDSQKTSRQSEAYLKEMYNMKLTKWLCLGIGHAILVN